MIGFVKFYAGTIQKGRALKTITFLPTHTPYTREDAFNQIHSIYFLCGDITFSGNPSPHCHVLSQIEDTSFAISW